MEHGRPLTMLTRRRRVRFEGRESGNAAARTAAAAAPWREAVGPGDP
jgi:hypothetical protein